MLCNSNCLKVYSKGVLLMFFLISFKQLSAQKLIDYLDVASKNFSPELNDVSITENPSTQLEFGYFVDPQYTISGAQKAYIGINQKIPWLGKSAAYIKAQKHSVLQQKYEIEQQKEVLKFNVKESYYQLYNLKNQKDAYVILSDKLRKHIENQEKDTLITSAKAVLKLFERKQQLTNIIEKLQLVEGDYQNVLIRFNSLLKQDSFQKIELPLELAMPDQDQAISFSDSYESPLFLAYENQLNGLRQAQKYKNKWLPNLSLGIRFTQVTDDENLFVQLPSQNLIEPRLQLQWDLFSKKGEIISKQDIETRIEQKVFDISSLLQENINEQVSARISYFSALEKKGQLVKLKSELLEKNVSLNSDELFQLEFLETNYGIEEIQAVTNYYISSSKMLLYQ